jgi:1-deoxy-D-xylulose-5-phosphate synthase
MFDYSYLRSIPNIIMMAPKDENELRHMLKTAVECGGPVSVRYPRGSGLGVPMDEKLTALPIGKGEIISKGRDLAIFAIGASVAQAVRAAEVLAREGINATVVNARFIKPLDEELLSATARSHGRVLTVEENVLMGGFGSAVLELFAARGLCDVTVRQLAIGDAFVEHATQQELRFQCGIDAAGICAAVRQMVLPA